MFPTWFLIYLFVSGLIIPVTMLILGRIYMTRPPRRIGGSGFKTSLSVRSMETWLFAQVCWGRLCWRLGLTLLPLSAGAMVILFRTDISPAITSGIVVLIQLIAWILTALPVTRALKRNFTSNGIRR